MQPHDGQTTAELLAAGFQRTPGQLWMRRDSCWMTQCRRCLRWHGELCAGHWCAECYAQLHCDMDDSWRDDAASVDVSVPAISFPKELAQLFAACLLCIYAAGLFTAGLAGDSFFNHLLATLLLLATIATAIRRSVKLWFRLRRPYDRHLRSREALV